VPTGATAVVVGKALYEGVFTVEEALARARALAGTSGPT
jgi:phosphoribosylformimino-5-aminoimidazole carboxamide ribonucleotide (ProFAR) isomerase